MLVQQTTSLISRAVGARTASYAALLTETADLDAAIADMDVFEQLDAVLVQSEGYVYCRIAVKGT